MKRTGFLVSAITAVLLLLLSKGMAQQQVPFAGERQVNVVTWNLYLGGDISQVLQPGMSDQEILLAAADVWDNVVNTDFYSRADTMADLIAEEAPELLCLQEASLWREGAFMDPAAATGVAYDFVQIFLQALHSKNLEYETVAISHGFDVELPNPIAGKDIRFTDRLAVLARADLKTADLKLANVQIGTYETKLPIELGGDLIFIDRTWIGVDVKIRGKVFRLINTHLEAFHPDVRFGQAVELISGPAGANLPTILVGDFNSEAGSPEAHAYNLLLDAGFTDLWTALEIGDGFTCCQQADLLNAPSLDTRIDLILYRGFFTPLTVEILGEEEEDLTTGGLWVSDHAGVAGQLSFPVFAKVRPRNWNSEERVRRRGPFEDRDSWSRLP